jgi:hypothetical protein
MRVSGLMAALLMLAGLAVAGACSAQQAVPLVFKFAAGDVLRYEVTLSGGGSMSATGASFTPVSLQGSVLVSQRVVNVLADGSAQLETLITGCDLALNFDRESARFSYSDGKLRWYANGKESSPPAGDLSKVPLLGTPVTCTVGPDGSLREVMLPASQLLGEVTKSLPGLDPTHMQVTGQPILPSGPVRVGETWRQAVRVAPLGPGFPLSVTVSRTLESFDDRGGVGLAKLTGFTDARLVGAARPAFSQQGLNIAISDIRETITSTEFFNATAGRLMRGDYDLTLSTRISVDAKGQHTEGGLDARLRMGVQAR